MMSKSSPPSSPAPQPLQSISPPRPKPKPQPSQWSHSETVQLITAYKHKWYSLNRGQLKATQWHDLSLSLSTLKTATQCRHKIEKLRKRYRSEINKPNPRAWEYFDLMHSLHNGPLALQNGPISHALPIAMVQNPNTNTIRNIGDFRYGGEEEEEEDDDDVDVDFPRHVSVVGNNPNFTRFGPGVRSFEEEDDDVDVDFPRHVSVVGNNPNFTRFGPGVRRPRAEVDDEDEVEAVNLVNFAKSNSVRDRRGNFEKSDSSESEGEEREESGLAIAGEIRRFAERVVRMEERKMEMMRETERYRMEMEKKTTEMIRESQRKVVDTIARALGSRDNKKMKTEMD